MKYIQKIFSSLGTLNNIILYFENNNEEKANLVMNNMEDYINKLDDKFSVYKNNSEINLINKYAGIKEVKVSKETYEIISIAKKYSELTNGAFDITMKPIVDIWGKFIKEKIPVDQDKIKETLRIVSYNDIIINEKSMTIKLKNKGQAIDLGGIAKGYIIDVIKYYLIRNGFENALINLGGTVSSIGEIRKVGIRNPFNKNDVALEIDNLNENIVTSGIYEKYIKMNNKVYHHIINPYTGFPAETDLVSVTIIDENGALADCLATACIVFGLEKSFELVEKINIKAIFILNNGEIYYTETIKNQIIKKGT